LPPLHRGEKLDFIIEGIPKSSPPFEKERPGGVSGKAFSKS
jgi:hypothetical protein